MLIRNLFSIEQCRFRCFSTQPAKFDHESRFLSLSTKKSKSAKASLLVQVLKTVFPNEVPQVNSSKNLPSRSLQLEIYYPQFKLAFEFQVICGTSLCLMYVGSTSILHTMGLVESFGQLAKQR